ncbi:MAG: MgtC/SapB family protein [Xanthomonadales bacterium]|nr:MgtC/SapB family protein [Xanthomonadales bacterium]
METGIDSRLIGLGIAVGIGFIIGMQREWAEDKPVGMRSFALISALGGMAALLVEPMGIWVIAAGFLALGLVLAAFVHNLKVSGITTVMASLVVYLIGAAAVAGFWLHALVLGGVVTLLLHWKKPLHAWVGQLGADDFEIIARFLLITLIVLPVLPNRTFGPLDVFNPFHAWLMVVVIVAINLAGYIAFRLVGKVSGGWLAGVLGGLVSSTATTFSYAGMSRQDERISGVAALVILVASIVVYGRILLELTVVAPALVSLMVWPSIVFSAVLLGLGALLSFRLQGETDTELPKRENPAQIRMALAFGGLYVLILFAVEASRQYFGEDAIQVVALVSGLTDVDALTLSVGHLFEQKKLGADPAWRAIFLGSLSNLLFKVLVAGLLGSDLLRRLIWSTGAVALACGAAIYFLWP